MPDAKLTVLPVVTAPVRPSGHVCPRLHSVQRREAVWLQVSGRRGLRITMLTGTDDESERFRLLTELM